MALPSSGAISITDVRLMFGGASPHSLSEYYKNGAYVLSTDTAPNVPTSGAISLSNFYGAEIVESYVTTVTAGTAFDRSYNSAQSSASVSVELNGDIIGSGGITDFLKEWLAGSPRSFYQVRFTKTSDFTSGTGTSDIIGTFDSWLELGSEIRVDASISSGSVYRRTITITVEVRRIIDQVIVSSTGANIKAESTIGSPP